MDCVNYCLSSADNQLLGVPHARVGRLRTQRSNDLRTSGRERERKHQLQNTEESIEIEWQIKSFDFIKFFSSLAKLEKEQQVEIPIFSIMKYIAA